ncbi:hypothetical protein [Natronobeatus ordinarius]|uniref:hypothetical protein n=1 Tax=Natronobeatus ordinarius TaxID=2963433 RepID=UPI0020CE102F|nr:hypothetical protein [Natronobeatus ordinarius]
MIRLAIKWGIRILLVLVIIGAIVHVGSLDVAAQEDTDVTTEEAEDVEEYQHHFSDSLRLVESEWDGKTWVATLEADRYTDVTITDAGRTSDNNEAIALNRETVDISNEGRTTVEFTVEDNRQVTVDGDGTLVLLGHDDDITVLPAGNWTAPSIILGVIGVFVFIVANVLWLHRLRSNNVERVA